MNTKTILIALAVLAIGTIGVWLERRRLRIIEDAKFNARVAETYDMTKPIIGKIAQAILDDLNVQNESMWKYQEQDHQRTDYFTFYPEQASERAKYCLVFNRTKVTINSIIGNIFNEHEAGAIIKAIYVLKAFQAAKEQREREARNENHNKTVLAESFPNCVQIS